MHKVTSLAHELYDEYRKHQTAAPAWESLPVIDQEVWRAVAFRANQLNQPKFGQRFGYSNYT